VFLKFHDVSYTYPFQDCPAVENLTFSVAQGEFVGILGANDSGKSTIAKLCNGLLLPSEGRVTVDGMAVGADTDVLSVRRKVGLVFPDPENQIVGTTVEEEVAFGLGNLCVPTDEMRERIASALERVGLAEYTQRAPHQLSGGEQQKLCLASVLAMEPGCVILDDPLTFLDAHSKQEILKLLVGIHKQGATLVYLTSDPEELVYTNRIFVIHHGHILTESSPAALWKHLHLLKQAGIVPSDTMIFRELLHRRAYLPDEATLTSAALLHALSNGGNVTS
jgi:energy-coupling factor transport system ATP-binding protein